MLNIAIYKRRNCRSFTWRSNSERFCFYFNYNE